MGARFHTLRLLADDMTGALDSAAAFVRLFGALDVGIAAAGGVSPVLDSGTREMSRDAAAKRVAALAAHLAPVAGRLSFFKLDSLLRGHAGVELAALLNRQSYDHILLAPAMPFQGRVTRTGRQNVRENDDWCVTGEDLAQTLREAGLAVRCGEAHAALWPGITLMDAADEADLDVIVAAGLAAEGSVLWVGSGGLTGALARGLACPQEAGGTMPSGVSRPVLGLVGSHHPVMLQQIARVGAWHIEIADAPEDAVPVIMDRMAGAGAAFLTCALPEGDSREDARGRIERRFTDLVTRLPPPGLLFVSGGETLRALMTALGASCLTVFAEIEPGAPLSRLVGGRWHGVSVLSKSGAFGAADFLENLLISLQNNRKVASS